MSVLLLDGSKSKLLTTGPNTVHFVTLQVLKSKDLVILLQTESTTQNHCLAGKS